jgi:hypothetical protein
VLCLLSYVRVMKPPAGVEPAPRPYKGRVLAVDTTEALMETVGVEPTPPRCKRGALPPELHPPVDANGWSRTTTARGTAFTARGALQCSASARKGRVWLVQTGVEQRLGRRCRLCRRRPPGARSRSKSSAGRSSWPAKRGQTFRRRADVRIRTGTSRITTSDAAVTPRPPCADVGFPGVGFDHRRSKTGIERREIIMAREAGRIFRRKAGTTGLEPADLSPDKRLLLPLSYVPM